MPRGRGRGKKCGVGKQSPVKNHETMKLGDKDVGGSSVCEQNRESDNPVAVRGDDSVVTCNNGFDDEMGLFAIDFKDTEDGLESDSKQLLNLMPVTAIESVLEARPIPILHKMADTKREFDFRRPHWVYTGKAFSQWRERISAVLAREELKDLLWDTDDELKYRELRSSEERFKKMREYDKRQDKARDIIYEHVDDYYLDRIRDCATVKQMIEKLEREYRSKSEVAIIAAENRIDSLRYQTGSDLRKYIDAYELRVRDFRDVGGEISDRQMVHRLHKSLPVMYDSVMDWLSTLSLEERTFSIYREKIIEKYERVSMMAGESKRSASGEKSGQSSDSTEHESSTPTEKRDRGEKKCYICKEYGHLARNCPLLSTIKVKEEPEKQKTPSSEVKVENKADWSKFRSSKKPDASL